jgi:hypothetical protein
VLKVSLVRARASIALARYAARIFAVAVVVVAGVLSPGLAMAISSTSSFRTISAVNGFQVEQLPASQLNTQLASMQSQGVQVVRADAPWAQIQPAPPTPSNPGWQWSQTDAWVTALATRQLTWEPILDYAVGWAKTCPGFCAPSSDSTFAAYAQAIAARYGAGGTFWGQHRNLPYHPAQIFEVWNEENVSTYSIPAARYATLYAAARSAVHAVDATASVIVGGLADDSQAFNANTDYPAWYVIQMFAADPALKGNVDGFGLHPYANNAVSVGEWVADFRTVLSTLGEGSAPVDITEVGWPASTASRDAMMTNVAAWLSRSNCGIGLLAPYDWINPGEADPASDFGLVNASSQVLNSTGSAWFSALKQALSLPELTVCAATGNGNGSGSAAGSVTTTTTQGSTSTLPSRFSPAVRKAVSESAPRARQRRSRRHRRQSPRRRVVHHRHRRAVAQPA